MKSHDFDFIILGGGSGGLVAAKLARGLGKRVAIIEKKKLGGECTWTGCIPSKTLINIAYKFQAIKDLQELGIVVPDTTAYDTAQVMSHVRATVEKVYSTHTPAKLDQEGITTIIGPPQFRDPHTLLVDGEIYKAKKILLATGSSPFVPPIEGLESISYHTNETIFSISTLPASLLIIGGGPIGIEMAHAFHKLGVKVSLVEQQNRIMGHEDEELASLLAEHMRSQGISLYTGKSVEKVVKKNGTISAQVKDQQTNKYEEILTESVLVAVGRKPNVDDLDLEKIGVVFDKKGIKVDTTLRTTVKNIYACGDVVGPYLFSHMAERQAVIATRNALLPLSRAVKYDHVAWVTFSDPELAAAGLTEQQAREEYGGGIKIYKQEFGSVDRGMTDGQEFGLAKFICTKRGKLLGAHILGSHAGEIMHEVQLGKTFNIPFWKFDRVIHAYPTYNDSIKKAARRAYVDKLQQNIFIRLVKALFGK